MNIPFLNLRRQSEELNKSLRQAFADVVEQGVFILGHRVEKFEKSWARFCDARGAVGVANGTDAVTLALQAANVICFGRGDEVITAPLSAGYTALGIVNAGAKPVFADIDEQTLTLDAAQVERAITPRTKAILPVHLYGQTAQMNDLREIAERRNLIIIEDAAQAHGAKFEGKACGKNSLAATFSFYPTKNLGALGDGGAIVSDDEDFLRRVRQLRQGGHLEALSGELAGRNSRLDEMQAAFLQIKLHKLDEWTEKRRRLAEIYCRELAEIDSVGLPFVRNAAEHVFHLFVIRHKKRDALREFLAAKGIETLIHYPFLLHEQKLFSDGAQVSLPVAEKVCQEIISLPLYPQMTESEAIEVCAAIKEFTAQSL